MRRFNKPGHTRSHGRCLRLQLVRHKPNNESEFLSTSFETIERNTREQLATMLGSGGFDPANDIEAITVNRWPHGYAASDELEDDYYEDRSDIRYSFVAGRQPFGRITIANSDAGANASFNTAVRQAYRAVEELG